MRLTISQFLKDALADLYFRQTCDQLGWAYALTNDILFKEKNMLVFVKGPHQIRAKVHEQIALEITRSADTFDYLVCKVGQREDYGTIAVTVSPLALCWVKTKNGKNFTDYQLDQMGKIKLPLAIFRVRDVLAPPAKVETKWETKSSKEWLDEIDDKRDEAESDDDYL